MAELETPPNPEPEIRSTYANPTYGVSMDIVGKPPSYAEEFGAYWHKGWFPQHLQAGVAFWEGLIFDGDKDYNPWDELKGYEDYTSSIIATRTRREAAALKARIDQNLEYQRVINDGQWGLLAALP